MSSKTAIGYVGLGQAGWPMAQALVRAGYRLVVHDADSEREERFAREHACEAAGGIAGLAGLDLVLTMLPNGQVVRRVLLEQDGGLAALLPAGAVVVDTSSSDPLGTQALGAELAARGVAFVDAPVTRPEPGNARLTIMVGGDDEAAVERAVEVLSALAERVVRVGPLGSGHVLKTLNNYVAASGLVAALDALVVGARFGLDPAAMLEVWNAGTAQNFSTRYVLGDESLSRRYDSGFKLALLVKDLGIAVSTIAASGFESELPAVVREALAGALDELADENADHAEAIVHWEHRAGLVLGAPGAAPASAAATRPGSDPEEG